MVVSIGFLAWPIIFLGLIGITYGLFGRVNLVFLAIVTAALLSYVIWYEWRD
ncbi:MAG: hypothetical protein ACREJ4_02480 [Candidatus Methylomirabilaceae bacterium]